LAALLREPQKRNFEKWPILGRAINPNYFVGFTYDEEVNWMKKFIEARLDWIEKQFLPPPNLTKPGQGQAIALSTSAGEIYFTLDGTDPRASGGEVSRTAQAYQKPFAMKKGGKLFARVRQENRWGGPGIWEP
jgi:hypothetical protein